ncbi:hypothetical protein GTA08_BOTSDO12389 [Botryosphaeria dothidea]|uniref:Uncharacterized protein n=1 Tax=Botryosphaeria dothidea TaxID=55169 RepID=A0A8H4J4X4_9PEZI|nr:hypothetical protein GTA08_BOTSDO12389 [Botryosphaeria dothidea]
MSDQFCSAAFQGAFSPGYPAIDFNKTICSVPVCGNNTDTLSHRCGLENVNGAISIFTANGTQYQSCISTRPQNTSMDVDANYSCKRRDPVSVVKGWPVNTTVCVMAAYRHYFLGYGLRSSLITVYL